MGRQEEWGGLTKKSWKWGGCGWGRVGMGGGRGVNGHVIRATGDGPQDDGTD